jgi:branched-chain amino acid aminotransferase
MFDYPAYNNGEFCKLKNLNISILDFGFIHSDATYDVMNTSNGIVNDLDQHLDRFEKSCTGWRLTPPSREDIKNIILQLIDQAPTKELLVWICVTRGTPDSGNPRDLKSCQQKFYAYVKPYYGFNSNNSATVYLAKQKRNTAINQTMKNFAWNDLNLAQWEAIDAGYDTAVLLDSLGDLTEGPGFNLGIVKDGRIYTPMYHCLRGVTMDNVERLCKNTYDFKRITISVDNAKNADAMFLTSTAGNIITVSKFDDVEYKENEVLKWLQSNI